MLGELAQASQGEGPKIAASISAGTQLAGLLDRTLNAQILALQSFAKFTQAVAPAAGDLNNLNAEINAGLPVVQRRGGRLREPPQHADPVLQPPGRAALDVPPRHRDHSGVRRQRLPSAAGPAGLHRPGHQRRLPLLPEDRRGRVRAHQAARRQHVRLLQHVHPLQRRQQPRLQPHCAARPAGCRSSSRFSRRWPAAGSAFNCSSELATFNALQGSSTPASAPDARSRPPRPPRAPNSAAAAAANQAYGIIGQPDHVHADQPRRHHHPASRGTVVRLLRHFPKSAFKFALFALGVPRPAGGAGRQDREHLAVQQPAHHRRAVERRDRPGQRATTSTSPASRWARSRASACSTGTPSSP